MAASPSTEREPAEAPATKLVALTRSAVNFHESRNTQWSAVVPRGTTAEQLQQSGLWSVVCDRFKSFDLIHIIEESRAYYAQALVVEAGRGYCSLILLNLWPLPALLVSNEGLPPGFDCFFAGPLDTNGGGGYCVKRLADGVLLVKGKPNRDAALAELLDHATLK